MAEESQETPRKYHVGNTFIYEPSGRIHFVNLVKNEYYWTAITDQMHINERPDDISDGYFGFKKDMNELFYFSLNAPPEKINCQQLETRIQSINKARAIDDQFEFSKESSTLWLNLENGTVFTNADDVRNMKFDLFEIERRTYHIWTKNTDKKQKIRLKFTQNKFKGPCLCKGQHGSHTLADYAGEHREARQKNMYNLEFRDYTRLLEFEKSLDPNILPLPKEELIVFLDKPVIGQTDAYRGLYLGHLDVVVKKAGRLSNRESVKLSACLHTLSGCQHFVKFHKFGKFNGESFLIFENFDYDIRKMDDFDVTWTQEEVFKNARRLIEGLVSMDKMTFTNPMHGNIRLSNCVVVGKGTEQRRLKMWVHEFGFKRNNKKDDSRDLGTVLAFIIKKFDYSSYETKDLINCLQDASCNIGILVDHPTFWTPEEKLDFICVVWQSLPDRKCKLNNNLHIVERNFVQTGYIHRDLMEELESFSSYSIGRKSTRVELIVKLIRNAKTHEPQLSKTQRKGWEATTDETSMGLRNTSGRSILTLEWSFIR